MKPVDQTLLASRGEPGDCWRACIASILELPIEDVPHFTLEAARAVADVSYPPFNYDGLHQFSKEIIALELPLVNAFLLPLGKRMRPLTHIDELEGLSGYAIGSGPSTRIPDVHHAVVIDLSRCRVREDGGWNIEIAHDPNPDRDGVTEVTWIELIEDIPIAAPFSNFAPRVTAYKGDRPPFDLIARAMGITLVDADAEKGKHED